MAGPWALVLAVSTLPCPTVNDSATAADSKARNMLIRHFRISQCSHCMYSVSASKLAVFCMADVLVLSESVSCALWNGGHRDVAMPSALI